MKNFVHPFQSIPFFALGDCIIDCKYPVEDKLKRRDLDILKI